MKKARQNIPSVIDGREDFFPPRSIVPKVFSTKEKSIKFRLARFKLADAIWRLSGAATLN